MPQPSEIVLHALPLWLALVLLLPKRTGAIRERLRVTAAGERRHPFGPPMQPTDGISSRFLRLLFAELPRCLELGVPLWLATLAAERRGVRRRQLAAAEHAASPSGWIWAHALGRLGGEELERRLSDAGYPPPAHKVERPSRVLRLAPPGAWLRDLDTDVTEAPTPASCGNGLRQATSESPTRLSIQLLGGLRVSQGNEDLTAKLLDRPTLSYLWQYLLVRAVEGSGPLPRSVVADEVYPGIDPETQHARIRRRLHDLQRKLPPLGRYIVATDRDLRFELENCEVDVVKILRLADEVRSSARSEPELLTGSVVRSLEDAAAASATEPLPMWEELEYSINRARGQSGEHVRTLRARILAARANIMARLGTHYLAQRSAEQAVRAFEEALRLDPGCDAAAEMLARALAVGGNRIRTADADHHRRPERPALP